MIQYGKSTILPLPKRRQGDSDLLADSVQLAVGNGVGSFQCAVGSNNKLAVGWLQYILVELSC